MRGAYEDRMEPSTLKPGDDHYRAYVGPPLEYDLVGASQFRLLVALGLRAHHRCLDVGCGSLRAGRLLIPWLEPDHYRGIEPNAWLVDAGIEHELGREIVRLKRPRFDHNDQFDCAVFGHSFDFIIAQSVLSHTGGALFQKAIRNMAAALEAGGVIVATFVLPERKPKAPHGLEVEGWIYPGVASFTAEQVEQICRSAGLVMRLIPWRHPRQQWFIAGIDDSALPPPEFDVHLIGETIDRPER